MSKLLAALLVIALSLAAQQNNFNGPFPPHKVIGNVYYVGSDQLATFLITTPQGNIVINVTSTQDVSQPNAFSKGGKTVVTESQTADVTEQKSALVPLGEMPTVEKVASALNALGATPRDMMAIFEAMKQAGALQAELIIR